MFPTIKLIIYFPTEKIKIGGGAIQIYQLWGMEVKQLNAIHNSQNIKIYFYFVYYTLYNIFSSI